MNTKEVRKMCDEALELLWADMFPNCSESDIADLLGW